MLNVKRIEDCHWMGQRKSELISLHMPYSSDSRGLSEYATLLLVG